MNIKIEHETIIQHKPHYHNEVGELEGKSETSRNKISSVLSLCRRCYQHREIIQLFPWIGPTGMSAVFTLNALH